MFLRLSRRLNIGSQSWQRTIRTLALNQFRPGLGLSRIAVHSRNYAQGPGGGGFPGGLQFGMEKMEKGQALKEFVCVSTINYTKI